MLKKLFLFVVLIVISLQNIHAQENAFITTWKTGDEGSVTIAVHPDYIYNYNIVVKQANTDEQLAELTAYGSITIEDLPPNSNVTIAITGTFPAIYMQGAELTERDKLKSIDQWGDNKWQTMEKAFNVCRYFTYNATDNPDLSEVESMEYMFGQAVTLNGDFSGWNVSNVTNMDGLFSTCWAFNGNISGWDVSNVTTMRYMFSGASKFNGDISEWNVGNVTQMTYMFFNTSFSGDISQWNVSSVKNMAAMFYMADFSGNISAWDVSNVTSMRWLFYNSSFNGDISGWNVSNVTDLSGMFQNATNFNQDLSGWNVSNAFSLGEMFKGASSFNQDLSAWSAKATVGQSDMFKDAGDSYSTITYNIDGVEYLGFYPAGHSDIELRTLEPKDGASFYGWNTASDFSGEDIVKINSGETGDRTYYAHWATFTGLDNKNSAVISYYPNPVLTRLNITGLDGQYTSAKVFNAAGSFISKFKLSLNDTEFHIEMGDYAPGVYLLQLNKADGTAESYKLIKK